MSEQALTFNQINEQLATRQPASVLVEHHDGTITVGQVAAVGEQGAQVYYGNLNRTASDRPLKASIVAAEKLSDTHQQKLAAELAGVALRSEDDTRPRLSGWDRWKQDHPLSEAERAKIRQQVNKNTTLSRMYGSSNFNVKE